MSMFILDSGAFSAWTVGKSIDIDHYIAFIKAHIEHIDYYVNLDVIPGAFGRTPDAEEVERSAAKSWENMLYMEQEGLKPIPVFHMGEQFRWLRMMMEHGCPYIGISPANDRPTQSKRIWLDRVFHEITDSEGWPLVKTHAFGVTALDLLLRYPWFSADSTTWIMLGARGSILLPVWDNGKWNFDRKPHTLYLSEPFGEGRVLKRGMERGAWRDIPSQRERVLRWIEEAGSNLALAESSYLERSRIDCYFFQRFEREHQDRPFKRTKNHMFEDV